MSLIIPKKKNKIKSHKKFIKKENRRWLSNFFALFRVLLKHQKAKTDTIATRQMSGVGSGSC